MKLKINILNALILASFLLLVNAVLFTQHDHHCSDSEEHGVHAAKHCHPECLPVTEKEDCAQCFSYIFDFRLNSFPNKFFRTQLKSLMQLDINGTAYFRKLQWLPVYYTKKPLFTPLLLDSLLTVKLIL